MKETTRVLAFDYGASSGRAILCSYQEGRLSLQEVHRFDNEPVEKDGTLFWNLEDLYQNLLTGLEKARAAGGFDSVGVDTWGVDFGLLGADGALFGSARALSGRPDERPFRRGVRPDRGRGAL